MFPTGIFKMIFNCALILSSWPNHGKAAVYARIFYWSSGLLLILFNECDRAICYVTIPKLDSLLFQVVIQYLLDRRNAKSHQYITVIALPQSSHTLSYGRNYWSASRRQRITMLLNLVTKTKQGDEHGKGDIAVKSHTINESKVWMRQQWLKKSQLNKRGKTTLALLRHTSFRTQVHTRAYLNVVYNCLMRDVINYSCNLLYDNWNKL